MVRAHRYILQIVIVGLLIISTSSCGTQPAIRTFTDLEHRLQPGNIIYITNHDGKKTRAIIVELMADALMVDMNGSSQRMEQSQIRQIDRHDNIILQGFGIGLGSGVLNAVFSDAPYEACKDDPQRQCPVDDSKERLIFTGILAAAGAGVGALIRRRDDPVYLASESEAQLLRPSISIMPVVNKSMSMPGLSVSLRF